MEDITEKTKNLNFYFKALVIIFYTISNRFRVKLRHFQGSLTTNEILSKTKQCYVVQNVLSPPILGPSSTFYDHPRKFGKKCVRAGGAGVEGSSHKQSCDQCPQVSITITRILTL